MTSVAMVTGAARGIGRATVGRLLEAHYTVVAVDLDQEGLDTLAGSGDPRIVCRRCDVTDRSATLALVDEIETDVGTLVAQVNAAGVFHASDLLDVTAETFQHVMAVNVMGVLFSMQAAARRMIGRGDGAVVNLSSAAGRTGRAHYAIYAASKAAVISMTRSAALAWAPLGVRCNAVAPGVVETAMQEQVKAARNELGIPQPPDDGGSPVGRPATPEEIADVVTYLLSPRASFINGQTVNACGGIEMD